MWHDNQTEMDLFGFQRFVHAIVDLVKDERLQPLTIGVHGTWGSGKSSVMAMAFKALKAQDGIVPIWISGWTFESAEHVKAALISAILRALQERQSALGDIGEHLKGLRKRVSLLRAVSLIGKSGLAIGSVMASAQSSGQTPVVSLPTVDEIAGIFTPGEDKEDDITSVAEFHDRFAELIRHAKLKSLVIFIDDLDRCMPKTIIESFEAIRLFLAVPKTVFIIGASEEIIQGAIDTQYPEDNYGHAFGRQYLEKIIQVPLHLPPLNVDETLTYLNLLFTERSVTPPVLASLVESTLGLRSGDKYSEPVQYSDIWEHLPADQQTSQLRTGLEIADRIASGLHDGTTGNPREVKRFLNALMLRQAIARSVGLNFDLAVMAKLMLLEYYHNSLFRKLFEWHLAGQEAPDNLRYMEDCVGASDFEARPLSSTADESEPPEEKVSSAEQGAIPVSDPRTAAACREWLEDPKVKRWLMLPPSLADKDLTPYFYVAREGLNMRVGIRRPLSPAAVSILRGYKDGQTLEIKKGEQLLRTLEEDEARAVYQRLFESYRTQPDDKRWRAALISVATVRIEVVSLLLNDLGRLPPSVLLPGDIMAIAKVGQVHPSVKEAVLQWLGTRDQSRPEMRTAIAQATKTLSRG